VHNSFRLWWSSVAKQRIETTCKQSKFGYWKSRFAIGFRLRLLDHQIILDDYTLLYNSLMLHRSQIAVCYVMLAVFLASCTPATETPRQTSLFVYRFDPPAYVEYSTDFQPVREIPFSIPLNCGLNNTFPAPVGRFLLIELNCPNGQTVLLLDVESASVSQPVTDADSHFLAWTSDGRVAYLKIDSLGSPQVIRAYTDGRRDVLAVPEFTYDLSARPDSHDFTYTLSQGFGYGSELYFAQYDGRISDLLYSDPYNYISFARYSPDGEQITFIKIPDSQTPFTVGELWVIDADGANARKLADVDAGHGYAANWSPDGTKIAFVVRENPEDANADQSGGALISNISFVSMDSGNITKVTNFTEGYAETPIWSPNGNALSFNVVMDGAVNVFTVDIVTGERLHEAESACCPAWMRK
jgi:hypothetical protein